MNATSNTEFTKVSSDWFKRTISYEQGLETISKDRAGTKDFRRTEQELRFAVAEDQISVLLDDNNQPFHPTPHALAQISTFFKVGTTYPERLASSKEVTDHQLLGSILTHELSRFRRKLEERSKDSKTFLLRTRDDGTLRAWLSGGYGIINNEWVMAVIAEAIPDGRLSHWRGNSDTIYGNVLIPDSIRQEEDSEYGAMLSISNCEIGTRTLSQRPSTFRGICSNGCIYYQSHGVVMKQRHKGSFDLADLKSRMIANINKQVPLALKSIDTLLDTRKLKTNVSPLCIIAQVALDNKLNRTEGSSAWLGFLTEGKVTPSYKQTLFGIVNGFTRTAQAMQSPKGWVKFDELGGTLANMKSSDWERLCSRASHLTGKEIELVIDSAYAVAS